MPVSVSIWPPRRLPLQDLVLQAYSTDPCDDPIAPLGEHGYATFSRVIPSALAVLRVAVWVECDPVKVLEWYRHTRIDELGYLTAEQLVALGRAPIVIDFLHSIVSGERD